MTRFSTPGASAGALVCMTTHGRGGVTRAVLGSVAEAVVRGSDGPVLLVGPWIRSDWTLPAEPTLLAGFDGSVPARAGVRAAGDVAASLGGRVRVVEMSRLPDVLHVSRFTVGHVDGLEEAVAELRSTGVESDYEVVDGVDAADTLDRRGGSYRRGDARARHPRAPRRRAPRPRERHHTCRTPRDRSRPGGPPRPVVAHGVVQESARASVAIRALPRTPPPGSGAPCRASRGGSTRSSSPSSRRGASPRRSAGW